MLVDYLNQEALWEYVTSTNEYNEKTYNNKTIQCRKEDKIKLVRDKNGIQVVSNTTIYCKEPVQIDHKIDGRVVISIGTLTDLMGEIEGYEVYLI